MSNKSRRIKVLEAEMTQHIPSREQWAKASIDLHCAAAALGYRAVPADELEKLEKLAYPLRAVPQSDLVKRARQEANWSIRPPEHRKIISELADRIEDLEAAAALASVIKSVEREHPLPRCFHGNCLMDGGDELLEPPCGCRIITAVVAQRSEREAALVKAARDVAWFSFYDCDSDVVATVDVLRAKLAAYDPPFETMTEAELLRGLDALDTPAVTSEPGTSETEQ